MSRCPTPQKFIEKTPPTKKSAVKQLFDGPYLEPGEEYDFSERNKSKEIYMHRYSSSLSYSPREPLLKSHIHLDSFSPSRRPRLEKRPTSSTPESTRIKRHIPPSPISRLAGQFESDEEKTPKQVTNAHLLRVIKENHKEHDAQISELSVENANLRNELSKTRRALVRRITRLVGIFGVGSKD